MREEKESNAGLRERREVRGGWPGLWGEGQRCEVFRVVRSIWRYEHIPEIRGICRPKNEWFLIPRPNQTREPSLGAGRTHYIPPNDTNQTHPSSSPRAHAPPTTYADIQPSMDANGASRAVVPTPLVARRNDVTMLVEW